MDVLRVLHHVVGDDARAITTPEGWLEIPGAIIARAGVLEYQYGAKGPVVRELRDPRVIHSADALASYEGRPVLLAEHPRTPTGTVTLATEENMASLPVIGSLRNVRASTATDDDGTEHHVTKADVLIWHPDGIRAARQGVRQFSAGYRTQVQQDAGTYAGQAYDARQTADIGNHLVLTATARAGDITEFRMDSSSAVATITTTTTGGKMETTEEKAGRLLIDVFSEHLAREEQAKGDQPEQAPPAAPEETPAAKADDMEAIQADHAKMMADMAALEARVMALEGMMSEGDKHYGSDKMKDEEEDEEEKKAKGDAMDIEPLIKARLELIQQAQTVLPAAYDFAGTAPAQIRADVVSACLPDLSLQGLTEEQVTGAYLAALRTGSSTGHQATAAATRGDTSNNIRKASAKSRALAWYNRPQRGQNTEEA